MVTFPWRSKNTSWRWWPIPCDCCWAPEMVVGEIPEATDVLVIGAGPGGYAAALRAAQAGRRVTLIERDAVGGTCLNVGCIPSKALIAAAELFHQARHGAEMGVVASPTVAWSGVQAHLRRAVNELTGGVGQLLRAAKVEVVGGRAYFTSPTRVAVETDGRLRHYEFTDAIVATGSRPGTLAALPVDGERIIDSTGALFMADLPASVAVIGGGYIGVELGTALAKLGVAVTIVEQADRLLPELDATLAAVVTHRLGQLGVTVRTGHRATGLTDNDHRVGPGAGPGLRIEPVPGPDPGPGVAASDPSSPRDAGSAQVVAAQRVIVAVGRVPNSDTLSLDHAGVTPRPDGRLAVGPDRRISRHLFAIGDLTDGPALAHKATAEAEVAVAALLGEAARFDPAAIPLVVFCDPELISVGVTRAQAQAAGVAVQSFRFPLGANARARLAPAGSGATAGHVELIADAHGTVIGVHAAGPHVSELAGEAALAVEMAATVEDLRGVIHPHPTISEAFLEVAHGVAGAPLHVHRSRR
ncbi:MAG: FAD-dependent oxidoreductase [Acidimicrobiales bacterium]